MITLLLSKFLAIFRLDKKFWFKSTPNNIDHVLRFKGAWHPLLKYPILDGGITAHTTFASDNTFSSMWSES